MSAGFTGLAGCLGSSQSQGGGSYKVGVFAPLSGPFAPWGTALVNGSKLAKQDLEDELDVDIEIKKYDTQTDPSTALSKMKRAVTSDGIDFANGGVSSAVCTSMGSWASSNQVSYIAQGASNTLTGANCEKYMYSVYQSNSMMSQSAGPRMAEVADSWYLLYSNYVWGKNGQKIIQQTLKENGASVVGKSATPFPADSYNQYLNQVANSDADGVALIIPGLDARLAVKQMMNSGMGTDDDLKVMVHQLEDLVFWGLNKRSASIVDVGPTGWINTVDAGDEFKKRVAEQGQTDPFARHYMSYTSMDQHVRAAERAGSRDAEEIRKQLEGHEVSSTVNDIQPGKLHWRECDHQLVQPVHVVSGRKVGQMKANPYKQWFNVDETVPGSKIARSCKATGCNL